MKHGVKIRQRDNSDCAAACIHSICAHYGFHIPISRIRQLASTDQKGTNVYGVLEALEKIGFQAKGVKGTFGSLSWIPKPAIAHVVINEHAHHFVVIYGTDARTVHVMDPGDGDMHQIKHEEFMKIWSGVLILLFPAGNFKEGENISVLKRFLTLLLPHRGMILQILTGALVYTIIGLTGSIYVQKIVDYAIPDGNLNLLNLMSVAMIALLCMGIFIGYTKSLYTLRTGLLIDSRLILGYYKHVLQLPQQFFDTMRVGEILSRINDAVKIRTMINDTSINLAVNLFMIISSFILMFTCYWKLAVIILLIVPLYALVYFFTNLFNKTVERRLMENAADLESQLVESISAAGTIKSFALERMAGNKTEIKFYSLLRSVYKSGLNNLFSNFSGEFISRCFTIILLWAGAGFAVQQEITPGELLSFYALFGYFSGPANGLIGMNKPIQNALIAADRLFEIMDLEPEQRTSAVKTGSKSMGDIHFRNVEFRYGSRAPVFKDLDLTFTKGSVVAVVGESGSGKSTLINILQKFYPLQSGSVHIGEFDLRYIGNDSLRKLIGIVPQKIDLFAGTVTDNIAIGDEEPDLEKVISVCASIGILDFVEKLPAGFNTYLGENGALLSGGQRQRIAIARALYRDPEILILDEATSSLDASAEQYVQKMISVLRGQHKTVIMIAHRLSTVFQSDRIVVLESGKVAEQGTHEELLRNKKQYYHLWKSQFPMMV